MSTIHMTRGIPGSGKSTWAKAWVQEDPGRRIRVNRDDLRQMLFGAGKAPLSWRQEVQITQAERAMALTALEKGKDVVVDAMNLRAKWVKQWYTLGYPVEFHDFEVSLDTALRQNAAREDSIPENVIKQLHGGFTRDGKLNPPPVDEKPKVEKYEPDWDLSMAWIFDIDGTLAHMTGRSPYDYTRVSEDVVDEEVRDVLSSLEEVFTIIIVSGREDSCMEDTRKWLTDNHIRYDEPYMREAGDGRKDSVIKAEIFNNHIRDRYNVRGVFDDRAQVVRMWRDLGLKCFQVDYGNF